MRSFNIVVDTEDQFAPDLTFENFIKQYGKPPDTSRYRIISIELVTCPEDKQPVLVTECGACPRFIRRFKDGIECTKAIAME